MATRTIPSFRILSITPFMPVLALQTRTKV
jgi:hypothetical protein